MVLKFQPGHGSGSRLLGDHLGQYLSAPMIDVDDLPMPQDKEYLSGGESPEVTETSAPEASTHAAVSTYCPVSISELSIESRAGLVGQTLRVRLSQKLSNGISVGFIGSCGRGGRPAPSTIRRRYSPRRVFAAGQTAREHDDNHNRRKVSYEPPAPTCCHTASLLEGSPISRRLAGRREMVGIKERRVHA